MEHSMLSLAALGQIPGIVAMIAGLSLLIIVHEFGHWLVAQMLGFKTPIFSIGFGKPYIVFLRWRGTEFRLTPWLIGGYVAIPELGDESSAKEWMKANGIETDTYQHTYKAIWKRALVAVAGITMNIVLAVVLLFGLFTTKGVPYQDVVPNTVIVYQVSDKDVTVARDAGLQTNDRIVAVDGVPVSTFDDVRNALQAHKGTPLTLTVLRGGSEVKITLTPTAEGKIGVAMGPQVEQKFKQVGVGEAASTAVTGSYNGLVGILKGFGMMVGLVEKPANLPDNATDVHAIVGIVQYGASMFAQGWPDFVMFLVMISLNLAVFNILPIPLLDGGHLVFLALEKVRGKPLSRETQGKILTLFFYLFMLLLAVGLWNDFTKPIGK